MREAISLLMEIIESLVFARVFLPLNFTRKKYRYVIGVGSTVIILLTLGMAGEKFIDIYEVAIILSALLYIGFIEEKVLKCVVIFFFSLCVCNYIDVLYSMILGMLSGHSYLYFLSGGDGCYLQRIISTSVFLCVGYWQRKRKKGRSILPYMPKHFYGISVFGGAVLFMTILSVCDFLTFHTSFKIKSLAVAGVRVSGVLYFIAMIGACIIYQWAKTYKGESKRKDEMLAYAKEYCIELLEHEKEIRKVHHDIRHHIAILDYLAQKGEYQRLEDYLREMDHEMQRSSRVKVVTGNELLNAILSRYIQRAPSIHFQIEGVGRFDGISDYDICIICSNAIENAMEACNRLEREDKTIKIWIKNIAGNLVIVMENPIEEQWEIAGIGQKTWKKDEKNHGYGMERIRETIEKYHGSMKIEVENCVFQMSIVMPVDS